MTDWGPGAQWIEYHPKPSNGRWWTLALGLGTLIPIVAPFVILWSEIHWAISSIVILIAALSSAPILVVAWFYPELRYLVGEKEIRLRFGPMMDDRIRYDDIRRIRINEHPRMSMLASFRFPGISILDVDYIDEGKVRMCATTAAGRLMLIETDRKRYGVNPVDEARFLDEIRNRVDDPSIIQVEAAQPAPPGIEPSTS
jgi:hypothetical protein